MLSDIPQYVLFGQSVVLTLTSIVIIYPLVAYARNVAHTEAFVMLALALFSVTFVTIFEFVLDMFTVANVFRLAGGVFVFAGIWFFARDFINIGGSDRLFHGGFEDGEDD